jgi:hypothetical protein
MNIGYRLGAGAVLKELGLNSKPEEFRSDEQLMDGARRALLVAAQTKAELGLLSPGDPGYGLLKVVTAEHAKQEVDQVDQDPLTQLSLSQGAMLVFKQVVQGAAQDRLRAAQAYDAGKAAEEAKKKLAEGNTKTATTP